MTILHKSRCLPSMLAGGVVWLTACSGVRHSASLGSIDSAPMKSGSSAASITPEGSASMGHDTSKQSAPKALNLQPNVSDPRNDVVSVERMKVTTTELSGYALVHESSRNVLYLQDYRGAPAEASATGSGMIWAESGYWGNQIIAIDGVDVSSLARREWYRMIFQSSDHVRLSIRTRSKRIEIIDAYVGKGLKPNKAPEQTPRSVTPPAISDDGQKRI